MFAQSTDENIGGPIFKGLAAPGEWGKLVLIFIGISVVLLLVFIIIAYFIRRKILPKSDRKAKVLRLP